MTTLTVRKLDGWVLQSLRERGAARGVSMEQEARDVVAASLGLPTSEGFDRKGLSLPGNGRSADGGLAGA